MPIEFTPPRKLIEAYLTLRKRLRGEKPQANSIRDGTVQAVNSDGSYTVDGRPIFAVGTAAINPGEKVDVAWKDGRPKVILAHNARRAQFAPVLGGVAIGIVEQLIIFEPPTTPPSPVQFYLRNFDQLKQILFVNDAGLPGNSPTDLGATIIVNIQWGKGDADFFMIQARNGAADVLMIVYLLNRPVANEPFPIGFKIKAELVHVYNMTTLPHTFGTIAIARSGELPPTAAGVLKYTDSNYAAAGAFSIQVEGLLAFAGIAPNGDLLVTLTVRGNGAGTGRTGIVFQMGSLLINVTRDGLILANRLAAGIGPMNIYVTPNSTFTCTVTNTSTCETSIGGLTADAGIITVPSLTGQNPLKPADPDVPGTFNNYILQGPGTVFVEAVSVQNPPGIPIGEIFCSPTRATIALTVIGEFALGNGVIASFPGSPLGPNSEQVPVFRASRTMVMWTGFGANAGPSGFAQPMKIRDLKKKITSNIIGNPIEVFQNTLLFLGQASLIYSPSDTVPPFNHQFFVAGHNRGTGVVTIDLNDLKHLQALSTQAKLSGARTPAQIAIVGTTGGDIIQIIDSKKQLQSFFQPGPL